MCHPLQLAAGRFQRRTCRRLAGLVLCLMVSGNIPLLAQTLYWDINGKTSGAGGTSPSDTWATSGGSNKNWTTSSGGTSNTTWWSSGANAVFSAGTNATGSYTVTVSGTQNVSGITVQEGSPTLSGGTINFSDSSPDIRVAAGRSLTFDSNLTSSSNNLRLGSATYTGTTVFANDLSLAGTVTLAGGTLRLGGDNYSFGSLKITGNSTIDFAGNTTLDLTNFSISAGVTLTIENWSAVADHFFAANWSGASYDTMGDAPMNRVTFTGFTAAETGWDSYNNEIRPNVPEPSSYGALLLGALTAFFAWHRQKTGK